MITNDLHLHSTASDGVYPPAEVMRRVAAAGLTGASLTDHDTMAGVAEAGMEAERLGLQFIPGIEITAGDGRREIHLLGYGLDPDHEAMAEHRRSTYEIRQTRVVRMVERLQELGHPITLDDALAHVAEGMPGRPHVARAMVDRGIVSDVPEAFRLYLADGGAAFIPKPVFHVDEAIALIHRAGGAAVLAHPAHAFTDHEVRTLVRAGLDGIETSHPSHTLDLQTYYRSLADRLGLIPTGGSDYHGARDGEAETLSQFGVASDVMELLLARVSEYSSS